MPRNIDDVGEGQTAVADAADDDVSDFLLLLARTFKGPSLLPFRCFHHQPAQGVAFRLRLGFDRLSTGLH